MKANMKTGSEERLILPVDFTALANESIVGAFIIYETPLPG